MIEIYLISAFVISLLLTFAIKQVALKENIVDIPNDRSSHTVPTARGGGLAIALVWYLGLVVFYLMGWVERSLFLALCSGIVLSVVSFIDDLRSLSPKVRMIAQFLSVVLALYAMGGSSIVDLGFVTYENTIVLSILSIPFIIWFINLFNFLDGIDGYLGMEGVYIFIALWFFTGNEALLLLSFAILGFLIWNWPMPKAKIFCGDVGSTLIGFNVAVFAIYFQNNNELSIIVPLILSGLFWFDASLTLFRRWRNKEKLSIAHRKHAYQRIVQSGFSHAKTIYFAIIVNLFLFIFSYYSERDSTYGIFFLGFSLLGLWYLVHLIDKRKDFHS